MPTTSQILKMLKTMETFPDCDIEEVFTKNNIPKVRVRYLHTLGHFEVTDLTKNKQVSYNDYNEIVHLVKEILK